MLQRIVRLGLALALGALLTGCVHSRASMLNGAEPPVDPLQAGHVAGSIGVYPGWYRYGSYTMYVCDSEMDEVMQFRYQQRDFVFGDTPDIDDDEMQGVVFELALPDGEYSFCNFGLTWTGGSVTETFSAKEKFSVPFAIEAGKISYVGEFRCVVVMGRGLFGLPAFAGGYWVVRDRQERDMPLVLAKTPELGELEIIGAVPDVESYDNPLLRAEIQPES